MGAATLLAFDTATERMSVALVAGGPVHLHESAGGAAASKTLLPAALALLRDAGVGLRGLDAIGFGRGPGAFTGLRVACAVAQGLGLGLGRPLLALDSLALVADDARAQGGADARTECGADARAQCGADDVWVAMDARMDEVYAAHYRWAGDRWHALAPPALYTLPALAARWRAAPPRAVAGSAIDAFGERLASGAALRIAPERSRAAALARLAQAAWRDGERLDAADALPLYLRDKVALTSAERDAARAAAAR